MLKSWHIILCVFFFYNCEKSTNNEQDLISYLPDNSTAYITTENFDLLKQDLLQNDIIKNITRFKNNKSINNILKSLQYINYTNKAVLAFTRDENGEQLFSLIVKSDSVVISRDSLTDFKVETFTYNDKEVLKYSIEGSEIYSATKEGVYFYSNSEKLAKAFTLTTYLKSESKKIQKLSSKNNTYVLKSLEEHTFPISFFLNDTLNTINVADQMLLEYQEFDGDILINGVCETVGKESSLIDLFKGSIPQENRFAEALPSEVNYAMSITIDEAENLNRHIKTFFVNDSLKNSIALKSITEITQFKVGSETGLMLHSLDPNLTLETLGGKEQTETYRDLLIYTLEEQDKFLVYPQLFGNEKYRYLVSFDEFLVFSNSANVLKECISANQNGQTLYKSPIFEGIMQHMSDESSLFIYYNEQAYNELLNLNFDESVELKSKGQEGTAVQFIIDADFAHFNAVLKKNGRTITREAVKEQLQITIDKEILRGPQFLENHLSKNMDFYVQDIDFNLHLFDNAGKLLFKKRLDGPILGEVQQLDSFKNGRMQLAFSTSYTLYLIARNGKDVSNFPVKFKDEVTQPLAVFDYDNNKKYRLLVTQGKDLLMLDKDGKKVNGFKYTSNNANIISKPQHFRIGRKDYIVFAQGGSITILSRTGKDRIKVKENFDFSANEIYEYQDKFSFTDREGNLVQIDQNGNIIKQNLKVAETHKFTSTSKTLAVLSDNVLKIRSNEYELEFGNYTDPKIYYLNDKIYVTITDLQTNKLYLLDSQAKLISGFPVYGSSALDMGKIDKDRNLEIITRNGSNGILIYQLN